MTALSSSNSSDASDELSATSQIKALERTNRILQKRLTRSERTRAEIEETGQYQSLMLKAALARTEEDRNQLASAQAELIRLNKELETRIEVRTAALDEATDSLEQAKVQVVKSEKFSALGELVAGVAHEINNPIGCITSNICFVQDYGEQLLSHIALLQSVLDTNKSAIPSAAMEDIADSAEDIDLEYIEEDFPKLIASIQTSGDRIKAISQSLRTFARSDTTQKQAYDLHKGIDGTLLILRHRLKAVGARPAIDINKNYGDIPTISCYPGQINQVFMNILANAIDAMDEGHTSTENKREIAIATTATDSTVIINITDTAGGIPENLIARIFESQFTTKIAGKGTGLGLSIAHDIVTTNHSGRIECASEIGKGTSFIISLPIS